MKNIKNLAIAFTATTFIAGTAAHAAPVQLTTVDGRTVTVDSSKLQPVNRASVSTAATSGNTYNTTNNYNTNRATTISRAKVVEAPQIVEPKPQPPRRRESNIAAKGYFGFNIGANWLDDQDFIVNGRNVGTVDYDTGIEIGTVLGFEFIDYNTRAELELTNRTNDSDSNGVNGDLDSTSLMLNGVYLLRNESQFTPYVGAGIGLGYVTDGFDSDTGLAYQGLVGVETRVANTNVGLGYKYFTTPDMEFNVNSNKLELDYTSHTVYLGLRF